jgi:hypothetical protein
MEWCSEQVQDKFISFFSLIRCDALITKHDKSLSTFDELGQIPTAELQVHWLPAMYATF